MAHPFSATDSTGALFAGTNQRVDVAPEQETKRSVLVVEDDAAIRRLVRMVLLREGYDVEIAGDGLEAVLKLGVRDYDAIILDLMMPNLDGFTFMKTMSENDPDRLRRIIVTSAASPGVIKERLHGQPFALLPKPFDLSDLVAKVKGCVGQPA
jgi:two-component system, OmpR family, response regulator MprA